jgi:hypothetical protein
MTKKRINFKPASEIRATVEQEVDEWVKTGSTSALSSKETNNTIETNAEKEELYRLSLDIPKFLHKRIKKTCAVEGLSMKERLTEILLSTFPEK